VTATVFGDDVGPRGRRRVRVASAVAVLLAALVVLVVVRRLADEGEFDGDLWRPLTEWSVIRFLLLGLVNTLKAAGISMIFAVLIGTLMALGRLSRNTPVRWLAGVYVELFRAVPLLLLILFSASGLPEYGLDFSLFWYLVLGLVVYNSAVLGEIFRAGILSLDRGQTEAAYTVGLTYWQTMLLVVIPQAARRMIPALVSQLITLLKDTSLGFFIAYEELLRRAEITGEFARNTLQAVFVAAVIYIVINFALSRAARRLEVRQRRRYRAGAIEVAASSEDLVLVGVEGEAKR
jgi:glutamate transport system permease protein